MEIHYVIHGASQTASRSFVDRAVETLKTALEGTIKLLELAKEKKVGGFVYLSSMEVYGQPPKGHKVTENEAGAFSPLNLRNSYPIGKIASESLCIAYAEEYGVPCKIARLTQTFGKGVSYNDKRKKTNRTENTRRNEPELSVDRRCSNCNPDDFDRWCCRKNL